MTVRNVRGTACLQKHVELTFKQESFWPVCNDWQKAEVSPDNSGGRMTEEEKDLTEKQQEESDQVENDPRGDAIEGGSASAGAEPDADVDPQAEDKEPDPAGEGQS